MYNGFKQIAQQTNSLPMFLAAGPAVLTEGYKDQTIYQQFVPTVRVYHVNGKQYVKKAVYSLKSSTQKNKCRAIIDRDYDFFLKQQENDEIFIYTDAHSLETLLWKCDTHHKMIGKILSQIVFEESIFEALQTTEDLYDKTFRVAYFMGAVRLANEENTWRLQQNMMLNDTMFNSKTEELDREEYIRRLLVGNQRDNAFVFDILDAVDEIIDENYDQWEIMHGHDISAVFFYYINHRYRVKPGKMRTVEDFESLTRLTYNPEELQCSSTCNLLKTWAVNVDIEN